MKEKLLIEGVDLTDFVGIPYVANRHPENVSVKEFLKDLKSGANCELFALGIVSHAGFDMRGLRSIELWEDTIYTSDLGDPCEAIRDGLVKAWDMFLFLPKGADPHNITEEVRRSKIKDDRDIGELKKFHQAVYIGSVEGKDAPPYLIHLPLETGESVVWQLDRFAQSQKEYVPFKIKRPTKRRKPWDHHSNWIFMPL